MKVGTLRRPPEIAILNAKVTRPKEDASQPNVELVEVHWRAQILVGIWDNRIDNPLLREANSEERKLIQICNLVPPSVLEFSLDVGKS